MSEPPKKSNRSAGDAFYDFIGHLVPSCSTALRLVEIGQSRPLTLREKFVLKYNSPLCLHCNCKRETFDEELEKMRALDANRDGGNGEDNSSTG